MISFNVYGLIVLIFVYIPYMFYTIFCRHTIKVSKHKQIKMIETISKYGAIFFGFITISGVGYHIVNLPMNIIWVVLFYTFVLINYALWLRFFLKGRKEENLYDKVLIPYPIGVTECMIYLVSGIFLFNPIVIGFAVIYSISHIYLGVRRD